MNLQILYSLLSTITFYKYNKKYKKVSPYPTSMLNFILTP